MAEKVQRVMLNNGVDMPMLGLGVFQVPDLKECEQCVYDALMTGYRLIDTAAAYMNEEAVGRAIKRSGIPRKEIFVTSKLWVSDFGYEKAKRGIQRSLDNLDIEYIDLYLLHQSMSDYYGAWRALEEFYKAGKLRAIGVSNFSSDRLVDLILNNEVKPAVNQVELHPFFQKQEEREIMEKYNVQVECWGPFAEGQMNIFQNETLTRIGKKYGKTVAQVILRWDIQNNIVTIPKSVHKNRIEENFNVWDFELSEDDIEEISKMDTGKSNIIDHFNVDTVVYINNYKIGTHK